MKKIRSAAVLLAILVILLSCVACGDDSSAQKSVTDPVSGASPTANDAASGSDDPGSASTVPEKKPVSGIVGSWRCTVDRSKAMAAEAEAILEQVPDEQKEVYEELFKIYDGVSYDMLMEFDENSNFHMVMDTASVERALEQIKENIKSHLPVILALSGASMEMLEAALAQQGMTVDDYIDSEYSSTFDELRSSVEQAEAHGAYRYENSRLYLTDANGSFNENAYVTAVISGNRMELVEGSGESSAFSETMLPMTLVKE